MNFKLLRLLLISILSIQTSAWGISPQSEFKKPLSSQLDQAREKIYRQTQARFELFGINPDWVPKSLIPVFVSKKQRALYVQNIETLNKVAQIALKDRKYIAYDSLSDDISFVFYFPPNTKFFSKNNFYLFLASTIFFHEYFHYIYFTETLGASGRFEFSNLVLANEFVRNYIFKTQLDQQEMLQIYRNIKKGRAQNASLEEQAASEVSLSELFARLAADYWSFYIRPKLPFYFLLPERTRLQDPKKNGLSEMPDELIAFFKQYQFEAKEKISKWQFLKLYFWISFQNLFTKHKGINPSIPKFPKLRSLIDPNSEFYPIQNYFIEYSI